VKHIERIGTISYSPNEDDVHVGRRDRVTETVKKHAVCVRLA